MHRLRSSIPYDILHGINFSPNVTSMFAYLSYFPPPPPIIPGPPPKRSWTCSARSLSSSSCLISDDLNPPSLRKYIPLINNNINQSLILKNTTHISKFLSENFKSSSILNFFQNQLTLILLLIIFLSIFIFAILVLLLFIYIQRLRQRQLTSDSDIQTNNNNNNENNLELNNNNKNKKFYYHLIPYREKYQKRAAATTIPTPLRNSNNENNLPRLTNHDSPVLEVIRLSKASGTHINDIEEQEEAL